mmetsp:Transcript_59774/g.142253  ORF Transcript_59774/g.142253 Transcript_59774/m.142253 type:complete len:91 (+) Transcript_59774:920-1192(+)
MAQRQLLEKVSQELWSKFGGTLVNRDLWSLEPLQVEGLARQVNGLSGTQTGGHADWICGGCHSAFYSAGNRKRRKGERKIGCYGGNKTAQ